MLAAGAHRATRDRRRHLCLAGGVALNCVANGTPPARGPLPRHLDSAGRRRRRRRARARRLPAGIAMATRRAKSTATIRCAAPTSGPRSTTTRSRTRSIARALPIERLDEDETARSRRRERSPRARSSAGSTGAWSSGRARSAARSILGDAAQLADAVGDEPQDQVPRIVPAVRARRCCASASAITSSSIAPSPYMLLVAPVREELRAPMTPSSDKPLRHREAQRAALDDPGGHARRLLGAHSDGASRDQSALSTS